VIIITGEGDADGATLAVTSGAWDYLLKTSALQRVTLAVTRALEHRQTARQLMAWKSIDRQGIVGNTPSLLRCLDQVAQAAQADANVLITGETGTGKELFTRAIHANSRHSEGRMVVVDCAALPRTLVESVLFGHVKGAFTGARTDSAGLVKAADGGTLFLDEIGELPLDMQKAFLRVLHERKFRPVGATTEITSNFRLIAATNKNLEALVDQDRFRKDLFFRLRAITIALPALRDHASDLPDLVNAILARLAQRQGETPKSLSDDVIDTLRTYSWPGNVRELEHTLEAAVAAAWNAPVLFVQHLPDSIRLARVHQDLEQDEASCPSTETMAAPTPALLPIRQYRIEVEGAYLRDLMARTGGDVKRAAVMAGLSVSRLYGMLKEHGIR
jgi:two-component system NtrC family response regulator